MLDKKQIKGLTRFGFTDSAEYAEPTEFNNVERIRKAVRVLLEKRKTINKQRSSYWLKHYVERELQDYVANGELIYAMHLEGYKIQRVWDGSNAYFNIKTLPKRRIDEL